MGLSHSRNSITVMQVSIRLKESKARTDQRDVQLSVGRLESRNDAEIAGDSKVDDLKAGSSIE